MTQTGEPSVSRINTSLRLMLKTVLIAMMTLLLGIMMVQVVMRYGLNHSLIWAEELCRYLLVGMSMLGLFFAYERGEIAAVRMALHALPRRLAFLLAIAGNLMAGGLCLLLVYYGIRYASIAGSQPVPAIRFILTDLFGADRFTGPPMFWVYIVLPVGMALLGMRILADVPRYVHALKGDKELAELDYEIGADS